MNQSIGNKLTHSYFRIHRNSFAESCFNHFIGRQQGIDKFDQPFKANSITFFTFLFALCIYPSVAFVHNDTNGLAFQSLKRRKLSGKQQRAKIGDVPFSCFRTQDHSFRLHRIKH